MNQEKMGNFIAQCRKELHMTQAQLGEELGVTDKTVSKWENGTNAPNIALLNPLSALLHVSTNELLNGEKDPDKSPPKPTDLDIPSVLQYYADIDRKKSRKKTITIVIILVLLFISIISGLILRNNYDNCYVYQISSTDNGIEVNGLFVMTDEKDILSINSVSNLSRYDLDKIKITDFEYSLVSNDTEIQKVGNLSLHDSSVSYDSMALNKLLKGIKFYISEKSNYNLLLNDSIINNDELSIKFKYIDDKENESVLIIPLKLRKVFSNNKFIYEKGNQF